MKAVVITRPGDPEVLQLSDVDTPVPGPDQLLVRVHAVGVNRADLMQRRGNYPPPAGYAADIPGLEYAGEVVSSGSGSFSGSGSRVMGISGGATYAEYVVVHRDEVIPIPDGMSFTDAAAIPEAFLTAYDALYARASLRRGEGVLIHAVASGVGTAALQIARHAGCRVFGTARSSEKLERCAELGLDVAINAKAESFVDRIRSEGGVDVVIDLVGGDYLAGNVQVINKLGRIVVVGLVAGASSTLDMRLLLNKRAAIVGTVMRARSLEEKIQVARDFTRDMLLLFASGELKPVVDEVFSFDDVVEAHQLVEANKNFGKIILKW